MVDTGRLYRRIQGEFAPRISPDFLLEKLYDLSMHSLEWKLRLLERARETGRITATCREMGVSRSTYYYLEARLRRLGVAGLTPCARSAPRMPNALSPEMRAEIFGLTASFPTYSAVRIAALLRKRGRTISASGVKKLWHKWGLGKLNQRLRWLTEEARAGRAEVKLIHRRMLGD